MKKNMGNTDRIIRLLVAVIIGFLYFTNIIPGIAALILIVVAAIFTLTSIASTCPIYSVLGINTCSIKSKK